MVEIRRLTHTALLDEPVWSLWMICSCLLPSTLHAMITSQHGFKEKRVCGNSTEIQFSQFTVAQRAESSHASCLLWAWRRQSQAHWERRQPMRRRAR
jgi:hypothetical protein